MTQPRRERRDELLRDCFERARAHPFYRELHLEDFTYHNAPALQKHALLRALGDFQPAREDRGVYLVRSGGSTHAPLIFPVDIADNHAQRAALAAALRQASVFGPKTIALNLFGYADLYRSAAIMDDLLERCEATTLAVSAHARYEDMIAIAERFAPTHVLGTPSKLTQLAHVVLDSKRPFHIPELLYAGEVLRDATRTLLCRAFGTQQIWSLYGGAETGVWAWSNATVTPGLFSYLPDVVVEILSPDARGFGSIAVSNAFRRRFPVFRYRLGDVGRLIECDGIEYLELRGRDARSFQFDELTFDLAPFEALVRGFDAFQVQITQNDRGHDQLHVLLVGDADAGAARALRGPLTALLQHSPDSTAVEVRIVRADALYLDPVTAKSPALVDLRN